MINFRILTIIIVWIIAVTALVFSYSADAKAAPERYYQETYCKGQLEVRLFDRTRVDCLLEDYAIEYDFARKWAEAIGQSLHYGRMTGKLPGIALIIVNPAKDCKYLTRLRDNIEHYHLPICIKTIAGECPRPVPKGECTWP